MEVDKLKKLAQKKFDNSRDNRLLKQHYRIHQVINTEKPTANEIKQLAFFVNASDDELANTCFWSDQIYFPVPRDVERFKKYSKKPGYFKTN